jgi:hypothetical protein
MANQGERAPLQVCHVRHVAGQQVVEPDHLVPAIEQRL